jgi:large subunit ribosomal protein L15
MKLNELKANPGSRKARKRVGRGNGSGAGTYSGRGMKGQSARSGGRRRPGFEGGQTPLYMRMPKLGGFKNPRRIEYATVNVGRLNETFKEGETVNNETLAAKNLIPNAKQKIKILGDGELTLKLTVKADKISKTAQEKIEKAKGTVELPAPKAKGKAKKKSS